MEALGGISRVAPENTPSGRSEKWRVQVPPARFLLHPQDDRYPSGWVLLDGRLIRRGSDFAAKLYYDRGNGFSEKDAVAPPVTLKGTIHELIWLPPGIRGLRWQTMNSAGEFEQSPLTLRKVAPIERVARMVRRIVPMLWMHPLEKRRKIGLTFWRMILDLRGAYEAAGKLRAYAPPPDYGELVGHEAGLTENDRIAIRRHIRTLATTPLISVVMPVYNPNIEHLRDAIESVTRQLYEKWELCIADDASTSPEVRRVVEKYAGADARIRVVFRDKNGHISEASNSALALASGEFIALLDQDDLLPEHALYYVAVELADRPDALLVYSDEDKIDDSGERREPYYKPDWNYQLLLSQNYVSHLGVFRTELVRQLGGFRTGFEGSQDHDLTLRVIEHAKADQIRHVPEILYHWRAVAGSTAADPQAKNYAWSAGRQAVSEHLERTGVSATVELAPIGSFYRVRYELPSSPPLVSIIVPTRDQCALLRQCVESIRARSSYGNYEIVVVDNQSTEADALVYLGALAKSPGISVIEYNKPFNFSAINNVAVGQARGEIVCLLNNDTEVIAPGWIEEMVGLLMQPMVGIVGARLLYSDGSVQHAGVIVGVGGVANHAHLGFARNDPGYFGRAWLAQEYSAVTGACLMTRKATYHELGGLNEKDLPVAFNDVDFCLRARDAGYRVVWTPYAELYHHESRSRGKDESPEKRKRFEGEIAFMRRRWAALIEGDPYYNPNLSYQRPDFSLSHVPRTVKPWQAYL
jgi:glycosyltransferase involved in cell wall biosynthesis